MRCAECKSPVSKVGDKLWYCKECDKIIINKDDLIEDNKVQKALKKG